jgi:8-oxo-dGTP pyrophosphatase MutT (NUDIX family)
VFNALRDPHTSRTFVSNAAVAATTATSASTSSSLSSYPITSDYKSFAHSILYSSPLSQNRRNQSDLLPVPPLAKSNYQNRITRHAMESKYLTNLTNYKPLFFKKQNKFSVWHKVPVNRRSAVMVLLFLGNEGELRVVLTKRSRSLKSFSGHISLPGGKADNGLESEFQCARREMDEEIGISRNNSYLKNKFGFTLDELKTLPAYLARTFLAVAPCIGYINWHEDVEHTERRLRNLVLNPGESASVFSVPLRDFLQPKSEVFKMKECLKQSHIRTKWAGLPWNLRSFVFPLYNKHEINWLQEIDDLSSASEDETHEDQEFDVRTRNCWGLTANILHDVAEIVYHGKTNIIGEEDLIWSLYNHGQIQSTSRTDFEKRLINNTKGSLFSEVIPEDEINYLKELYK